MSEIKKDSIQISRSEHDPLAKAKRVKLVDTAISIELDHKDGDSVTAHPDILSLSSIGIEPQDVEVIPPIPCQSIKRVQMFVEVLSGLRDCSLLLQVSPLDSGDLWFTAHSNVNLNSSDIINVCARRLRVIQTSAQGNYELNLHLVGQG